MRRFSEEDKNTIWDMREAGVPVKRIAKHLGRQNCSVRKFIATTGGRRPSARERCELRLSLAEREEISRGLAAGVSIRAIARFAPITVDDLSGGERERRPVAVSGIACRPGRATSGVATQASQARPVSAAPECCRAQARGAVVAATDLGVVG